MNDFLLPPDVKGLIVVLQASTEYDFYQKKNNTDFVDHKNLFVGKNGEPVKLLLQV